MTIKLGIGSYAFAWSIGVPGYPLPDTPMNHQDFLQTAVDLGLKVAQIADNLPLLTLSDEERAALKAFADANQLTVEVGTRGIQPENVRRYLNIAQQFGSPILRAVVDSAGFEPDDDTVVAIVTDLLPEFEAKNIILAIENHDRFRAAQLVKILKAIDSPYAGICLDTVNSFGSLEGPEIVVEQLGPYVVNLHVKDFLIRRQDHNMGFLLEGTPAGVGMLDVPWLINALSQYGRDFSAIIELWPAPEANMNQTADKEQQWAQESVSTLRQWIQE